MIAAGGLSQGSCDGPLRNCAKKRIDQAVFKAYQQHRYSWQILYDLLIPLHRIFIHIHIYIHIHLPDFPYASLPSAAAAGIKIKKYIAKDNLAIYNDNIHYISPKLCIRVWLWRIIARGYGMKIIGRKNEKEKLLRCLNSKNPEFVVVYGRRRVGKTYLIREFFNKQFSFYATGLTDEKTKGQLRAFNESLINYGNKQKELPKDWFEAFSRLRELLESPKVYREPINNKRVIFLDELPWMDTARSDFKSALDYFWNSWGSAQDDLVLIVCGSATSWIINNLLSGKKGFHNRVTKRIRLAPFTLKECEELFALNDIVMTRSQMIESYMVFGGIPYYLNLMDSRLSLAQNINELCFKEYGELHSEYYNLFRSLFVKPEKHMAILEELAKKKDGITRSELAKIKTIGGGSVLTKDLRELEECGFIRRFSNYTKEENDALYQLIDPFTLFAVNFIESKKCTSWNEYINSPGYNSWRGNSFEIVCLNHIDQIKASLGISGVETNVYSWRSSRSEKGAQIDLIIDRKDGVINLCEMKYTNEEYALDRDEYYKIQNRLATFQKETAVNKAIHVTLVSGNGFKRNKYSEIVQNTIVGEELFD